MRDLILLLILAWPEENATFLIAWEILTFKIDLPAMYIWALAGPVTTEVWVDGESIIDMVIARYIKNWQEFFDREAYAENFSKIKNKYSQY